MTRDIFNYLVIAGTQQWFFENLKSAVRFVETNTEITTYPRIYKLVYANGELVKNVK